MTPAVALLGGGLLYGSGVLSELGGAAAERGLRRVLLVADRAVRAAGIQERAATSLARAGVEHVALLAADGEPTDVAIAALVEEARAAAGDRGVAPAGGAAAGRGGTAGATPAGFDGIVAVGGGSVLDTAKIAGLLLGAGGEAIDYVNPPFGAGRQPARPPLPLLAVPTTAGSGSEVSAIAVLDLTAQRVKTAISHPLLRPALAVVDPQTTLTLPPGATAAAGLDVLAHALESLTALPYERRALPAGAPRPAYSGANPYSDALCEQALQMLVRGLPRAVADGASVEARGDVMLAATLAALGAAVAGAHAGHACAYGIASRHYELHGDDPCAPPVAHGFAAALMLAPLLRRTYAADPARHARAARLLGAEVSPDRTADRAGAAGVANAAGHAELLPTRVGELIAAVGAPRGLRELGFDEADVAPMAASAAQQQRLLSGAPVPLSHEALAAMLAEAL